MIFTILIVFFTLILLIILHELGHFLVAKKFGVKVEEFGIFLPPRLYGKKIGETIYSLNLLPFGAFVRVLGEEGDLGGIHDIRSFAGKPIWQRALIVLGGVVAFWIIAAILLSFVMGSGFPVAISDDENGNLQDARVQITMIASDSPALKAGLKAGDIIEELKSGGQEIKIEKVSQVQEFIDERAGEEITLVIKRGQEVFDISLVPRTDPPAGQGAMGVGLARVTIKSYPWYQAPVKGLEQTFRITWTIIASLASVLGNLVAEKQLPPGAEVMGPIGIGSLMAQFARLGANYYFHFVAVISIYLAIFNILPIPALDGGKLIFLGLEAVRKKPVSPKIEQRVTLSFFALLISLIIWVTVRDIVNLF